MIEKAAATFLTHILHCWYIIVVVLDVCVVGIVYKVVNIEC